MKEEKILTIIRDSRIKIDGGVRGYYSSLNNIIKEHIIFKELYTEKTSKRHVYSEPIYKIIAKKNIIDKINKIDLETLKLMNKKCDEYSDFYKIIFTNGKFISFLSDDLTDKIKEQLDSLFENDEFLGNSSEKFIDIPPILDFTKTDYNEKLDMLKSISYSINHKNKKAFFKLVQSNCEVNIKKTNTKILGKRNFKKYVLSITGIFNFKIPYFTSSEYYGFVNDFNESDILLKISYYQRDKHERVNKYLVFTFLNSKISKIEIFDENEIIAKKLNDVAISFIKAQKYNDLNEDISNKIKNDNKSYRELLENLFPSQGTTTNLKDIRKKDNF